MSMVLGLRKNGRVWMAVDSVAAGTEITVIRKESKIFWNGEYLIGFCGSFRYGQVAKFCQLPEFPKNLLPENLPKNLPGENLRGEIDENLVEGFFVKEFIPRLQDAMHDSDVDHKDLEESSMLVAVGPWLFVIEPGWQVSSYVHDYAALGIAEQAGLVALDVLTSGAGEELDPPRILLLVMNSIEKHSIYVKQPYIVEHT